MISQPVWQIGKVPVDTNKVFYSGAGIDRPSIPKICDRFGLEIMLKPIGESYAISRWEQIQKAIISIFDLRSMTGPDLAGVTYELGIALSIGKPMVVLVSEDQVLPFDIDINPVVISADVKMKMQLPSH